MGERRRQLQLGVAGVKDVKASLIFSVAARQYLEMNKAHWSANNYRLEGMHISHLTPHFGRLLLSDINADDVSRYQASRKAVKASPRTINMEVGTLRAILRKHRDWQNIQPDVRMLRTQSDIGRALTADGQHRLLADCEKSRSRSLFPAVQLSLHSGLRNSELRLLRWRQVDLLERQLTVGKSKTAGGEGRLVPLSDRAFQALVEWRGLFPKAAPTHYVFSRERYGLAGEEGYLTGRITAAGTDPTKPIGSWKVAWRNARKATGVSCRWHDMRHTFVSSMAESHASDATIMALAGHVSRKMMERYSRAEYGEAASHSSA
jgi:integrase